MPGSKRQAEPSPRTNLMVSLEPSRRGRDLASRSPCSPGLEVWCARVQAVGVAGSGCRHGACAGEDEAETHGEEANARRIKLKLIKILGLRDVIRHDG
jgi:hypothetical protein